MTTTAPTLDTLMTPAHVEQYWEEGYTLIRNVFSEAEIEQMKTAIDRWKFMGEMLGRTWRRGNTIIWVDRADTVVRGMQWPSYHDAVMDRFRTDPRMLMILEPLIGPNVKQIINQVHWKKPGSHVSWPLHRDVRSRKPDSAFLNLTRSWVQTGIAIDPHMADNGAMQVVPGSHKDIEHDPTNQAYWNVPQYKNDPRIKDLEMDPGDVALWSAYTVHGGGFNTTRFLDRRLYINGFIKAEDCKRGEWAFRDGRTCHLHGRPALIQFEQIDEIETGHYPEDHNRIENVID